MNVTDTIVAIQKKLGVSVDGNAGPETWAAIYKHVVNKKPIAEIKKAESLTIKGDEVDSRSEKNIATLHVKVRPYARALVSSARAKGVIIKVISGTRTYEEQEVLYKKYLQGGPQAAAPGRSNHNFGLAFDIGVFTGSSNPEKAKSYQPDSPAYDGVGMLAAGIGLSWGGNWSVGSKDRPHYELRPQWAAAMSEKKMVDELARRKDQGIDPFA